MATKEKGIENRENLFYFDKKNIRDLPRLFSDATKGTPFEGSRLRFTGRRDFRRYEFELVAVTTVYQLIPGYQLVGYAKTEDGETFHVHQLADFEWNKALVDELDPLRCDVCRQRRVRKRQFVVRKVDTGELLFVGGSCARKFCDIDLEVLIRKFFVDARRVFGEIENELDKLAKYRDTCFEVALTEEVVRRRGYVSQKQAEINNDYATAGYIADWYSRRNGELTDEARAVRELVGSSIDAIYKRAKEFEETHFRELVDHFEAKLKDNWTEFDNNCVAWLKGGSFSWGLAAYFGSIKPTLEGAVAAQNRKRVEAVKGFDAVQIGKCANLGRFMVVNTKWKDGFYGYTLAFTCVSDDGGKLWFQVVETSKTAKDWGRLIGDRMIGQSAGVEVELRGTVSEIKSDISFAKRVKIQKIFENGKELS